MYNGDQARKKVLIEHGFRLPSAADNRPLKGEEFWEKAPDGVRFSHARQLGDGGERRRGGGAGDPPTGVLDPVVEVRPTTGQVDDLLGEIRDRAAKNQRVLVTTLTKRMAEDLTDYLAENEVRVRYLHSEIHSIERIEIIQDLRLGEYDVLVGVNLLREGLDLPEVSLVAILDADRRASCGPSGPDPDHGRAARHVEGGVALCRQHDRLDGQGHLRNRAAPGDPADLQREARHRAHCCGQEGQQLDPQLPGAQPQAEAGRARCGLVEVVGKAAQALENDPDAGMALEALPELIDQLEGKMKEAAKKLDFEEAANLRDRVKQLRQKMAGWGWPLLLIDQRHRRGA